MKTNSTEDIRKLAKALRESEDSADRLAALLLADTWVERLEKLKRLLHMNFSWDSVCISVFYAGFHQQGRQKSVQDG